jgi:hypothetical protein
MGDVGFASGIVTPPRTPRIGPSLHLSIHGDHILIYSLNTRRTLPGGILYVLRTAVASIAGHRLILENNKKGKGNRNIKINHKL